MRRWLAVLVGLLAWLALATFMGFLAILQFRAGDDLRASGLAVITFWAAHEFCEFEE